MILYGCKSNGERFASGDKYSRSDFNKYKERLRRGGCISTICYEDWVEQQMENDY